MSDEVKIPSPGSLQEIVGALLFASQTPLTAGELREAIKSCEPEEGENHEVMDVYRTCTGKEIQEALRGLEKALDVAQAGFRLVCTGGAYRIQTVPTCGRYVRAMLKMDRPSRIGRASLETLAIIAYRQPLTKSEIEDIRGVDVSGNIKTLMDLQLIRLVGKSELPGHPFLYGTTPLFLDHFGLASLQQLNELDPTLQRSNPKAKAASYKKKVEEKPVPAEPEKTTDSAPAAEDSVTDAAPSSDNQEAETREPLVGETDSEESQQASTPSLFTVADEEEEEEDIFIDDTEDEFDDEDDDDDDDADEDEEEFDEDEDEEEDDDEENDDA